MGNCSAGEPGIFERVDHESCDIAIEPLHGANTEMDLLQGLNVFCRTWRGPLWRNLRDVLEHDVTVMTDGPQVVSDVCRKFGVG